MTFWFARVGSFFSAASICFCRLLDSALALAPVSPCGNPELCGRPEVPTPVEGAVAPVAEEVEP